MKKKLGRLARNKVVKRKSLQKLNDQFGKVILRLVSRLLRPKYDVFLSHKWNLYPKVVKGQETDEITHTRVVDIQRRLLEQSGMADDAVADDTYEYDYYGNGDGNDDAAAADDDNYGNRLLRNSLRGS